MNKRWILKKSEENEVIDKLKNELNVNTIIASLLVQRGIKTFDDAKYFFRPPLDHLHDPFLMKDMNRAVAYINKTIQLHKKILLWGDYDVDGTTSVSMMYLFFKEFYNNIDYYIPDRYSEGYGVSFQGIDYAKENNFSLIISLDCGISSMKQIAYAKEKKIDFIVCDHHTPGPSVPDTVATLNPKQSDCSYPFKELSGCGVGFKLIQAICVKNKFNKDKYLCLLDLLVVSIAADIVSMSGENRILAFYGLRKFNENPCLGLKWMKDIIDKEKKYWTVNDIVFKIAPRINAAGRIKTGKHAVELLVARNYKKALNMANSIDEYNTRRKDIDKLITKEAIEIIEADRHLMNKKSIVIYNEKWSKGVIGIVASRLVEHFCKPTIVLTKSNNMATGSARSVKNIDVFKILTMCSNFFVSFGGHKYAAGLNLQIDTISSFTDRFEKLITRFASVEDLTPTLYADAQIRLKDITPKLFRILKQFEPFGPDNMNPTFITHNLYNSGNSRVVGKDKTHLKIEVKEKDDNHCTFSGIAFSMGDKLKYMNLNTPFNLCYNLTENEFRNNKELQLMVKDLQIMD